MKPFLRTLPLALALAALLATLAAPAAARAQADPVSLEVRAGLDGAGQFPVGHWFPVTVTAANEGPDLSGLIELRVPGGDVSTFRQRIELPRGARKQVTMLVTAGEAVRGAELVLLAGDATLVERTVRLTPITADQLALGVLSSDPSALASLGLIQPDNGSNTVLVRIDPAQLPADPMLLAGLDAVFVHDQPTAELSEAQRAALAGFAQLGGTLVVGGGPEAERTVPGLAGLLPVEVGPLRQDVPTSGLAQLAGNPNLSESLPALTASQVSLRAEATAIDNGELISAIDRGAGRVVFVAFALDALRGWEGEPNLWSRVVGEEPRAQIGYSYRWRSENLLRDSLRLPALRLPSTFTLLALILIYIVVVGPLNFWLLKRLNRVELAWVTTPALVALFLAAAYGASFVLRGTRPQITQLSVVQGVEGAPAGQATAFIGVFSPQRRSYELRFAPDTLVTPGTFEGFRFSGVAVEADEGGATTVPDLLIDVSALRTLIAERPDAAVPAIESSLRRERNNISGELRNASGQRLSDVVVVQGDSAQFLGDLGPGDSAGVQFNGSLRNFPEQLTFASGGLFGRDQVLYSLFGYDRFAAGGPLFQGDKGLPERDGVYLIGWGDAPALEVAIDGDSGRQQGQTLYIIRLNV